MGNIVVVGSLNMDLAVTTNELPRQGETVMGQQFDYICGGKGGNQAVAAAKMGAVVTMVGCVGNDIFGGRLTKGLQLAGVDTASVGACGECSSGIALITVKDGDNSIIVVPGANDEVTVSYITSCLGSLQDVDMILLQLESEFYTGIRIEKMEDAQASIAKLKEKGIVQPIITLGKQGVVFEEAGVFKHQPAKVVKAVDTTTAGDAFTGALAAKLTDGASLSDSVVFATAVSGIVVTKKGAQTSIPELGEVRSADETKH